jgi:hypothetical protein
MQIADTNHIGETLQLSPVILFPLCLAVTFAPLVFAWLQGLPGRPVQDELATSLVMVADLRHRHAVIALLQNERLLGIRKLRCLHRFRSFSQPGNYSGKLQL